VVGVKERLASGLLLAVGVADGRRVRVGVWLGELDAGGDSVTLVVAVAVCGTAV
jgi:hypothetical protein